MQLQDLVIQSQLQPPQPRRHLLRRPRLEQLLEEIFDFPLTIVQAGTGYGKSTALASLGGAGRELFWYTITEPDREPLLFLVHLISAFGVYGISALRSLEANNGLVTPASLTPLLNALTQSIQNQAVLVLDDFHLVAHVEEIAALIQKLVDYCPPRLHIVLSTRQAPALPDLNRWRVKGALRVIGPADLAFTAEEIESLFREQYHLPITSTQAQTLAAETEGWAIALQMIWQGIRSGTVPDLDSALQKLPAALDRLFDYLGPEVLNRLPPHLQKFLLTTSILRELTGPACDALLDASDSFSLLRQLHEMGLFIDRVGDETYRYQRLFHDFLLDQMGRRPDEKTTLHRRAAAYFQQAGHPEEALYHLLEAGQHAQAADLIEKIGPSLLEAGRLDSLGNWLTRLPAETYHQRPQLEILHGEVCRLRADFEEALQHYAAALRFYQQANDALGQSRALRGQAQVYLDTVRPLQAAAILSQALDLLDPVAHRAETAMLLEQLAENKLNSGFPDQARELHREAVQLRGETLSTDIYLEARVLLRTGKLTEARRLLESYKLDEPRTGLPRPQHFHREKQLLLSLICGLQGDRKNAEEYARQGIAIGQKIQSEFVEAVGFMRLGHALQLDADSPWSAPWQQAAIRCYQDVIEKVRPFKVPRVSLEPLWGLCRAYGYAGEVETAETNALQAIEMARAAGDEWIGNLVRVSMGAVLALDGRHATAARWLKEAAEGLDRVQDSFGWCAAQLWLAVNAWAQGEQETALRHLSALLPVAAENNYDFLLTRRTHLGLRDDQTAIPLLLEAYRQNIERDFTLKLLTQTGKRGLDYHPGYTLWVRTLGPFQVWRGRSPVPAAEWQREKARQLFQLFIATRGQWLMREQITDMLWPDLSPEAAVRDFKVALNTLQRALDPRRPRSASPYFIVRQGNAYSLNPQAALVTDADLFDRLAASDDPQTLEAALSLYEDDFLPECCYYDWASLERDALRRKYLAAAEKLARRRIQAQQWEAALTVCQAALRRDKCWEPGYALSMQAYAAQGNLPLARQMYQRCAAVLKEELGLEEPSEETRRIYQLMTRGF